MIRSKNSWAIKGHDIWVSEEFGWDKDIENRRRKEVINEMGHLVRKKVIITVGDEFLAVLSGLEFCFWKY